MNFRLLLAILCFWTLAVQCTTARQGPVASPQPQRRTAPVPHSTPKAAVDTVRWRDNPAQKPPIGSPGNVQRPSRTHSSNTYTIGLLLPFFTDQYDETTRAVPDKSRLAMQFYAGARIALEELSREGNINLVVDVYDTGGSDAEFGNLFNNTRFDRADVYIGPFKSSQVALLAERAKLGRKIVVSPETPSTDLTRNNPDFVQINPSLRAHCAAITQHARRFHRPEAITLVARENEADRLPYFQEVNTGGRMNELIVPNETKNFDNIDLRPYLQPNRTNVFVLPTWSDQDYIVGFLRRLKAVMGNYDVAVYGMPQWRNFSGIDVQFMLALNIHISSASYINYDNQALRDFQQAFYLSTGTIPDEDGFNGYDVTLFTGRMLQQYGLSFPERLPREFFNGMRANYRFLPVGATGALDAATQQYDYLENTYVYILKFTTYGFVPAD